MPISSKKGEMPRDRVKHNSKLLAKAARKYSRARLLNKVRRPSFKDVIAFYWAKGAIPPMEEVSPVVIATGKGGMAFEGDKVLHSGAGQFALSGRREGL